MPPLPVLLLSTLGCSRHRGIDPAMRAMLYPQFGNAGACIVAHPDHTPDPNAAYIGASAQETEDICLWLRETDTEDCAASRIITPAAVRCILALPDEAPLALGWDRHDPTLDERPAAGLFVWSFSEDIDDYFSRSATVDALTGEILSHQVVECSVGALSQGHSEHRQR